ncbi:MAG: helix-turn-helix transcriptional regulator [Paludibacteraceae bacterium]|nr:helix-turn-helix transcriptional regulator [Paludibacteraceae bacterium]
MLNKNEFKSIMAKHGDRQEDIALAIGMSPATLSSILNGGRREFRRNEIELMAIRYNLTGEDLRRIFFTNVVA